MRAVLVAVVALLLSGCAQAPAMLPDDVVITVYQGRFDRAERELELKVSNGTNAPLTITGATLDSTRFMTPAHFNRPQTIPPGAARDLRVQLGRPNCDTTPPEDAVVIDFTLHDGSRGTARVLIDDVAVIDAINTEDCLEQSVAQIATVKPASRLIFAPGENLPATLEITLTPTGAPGTLTVIESRSTVLLSLVDDDGLPVFSHPENALLSADTAPAVVQLRLIPARCDPHAVAEDKRGTIFPLLVRTSDGYTGEIVVPVSTTVRSQFYAFYRDYCGLP